MKKAFIFVLTALFVSSCINAPKSGYVTNKRIIEAHTDTIYDPVIQMYKHKHYETTYQVEITTQDCKLYYNVDQEQYNSIEIGNTYERR